MNMKTIMAVALMSLGGIGTTSAQEVTELKFSVGPPPQVHFNKHLFIPWAEKVSADSKGTLKVKMFFAGTLGKEGQFVDLVESGAVDIAFDIPAYYPGRFKRTDVAGLPMLITDAVDGSKALWEMYKEGVFGDDFDGLKVLAISTPPAALLITTKTPVTAPADMKGLKIAGGGKIKGATIETLGAAPVDTKVAELYQSMGRGVVDGALTYYTAVPPFKLHEVGKHYTEVPLGGSFLLVFMSQEKFDSLPEAAQKAIDMNSGLAMSEAFGEVWENAQKVGRKMVEESGGEIRRFDDAALTAWSNQLKPVAQSWVADVDGRQAVVDSLSAKLGK